MRAIGSLGARSRGPTVLALASALAALAFAGLGAREGAPADATVFRARDASGRVVWRSAPAGGYWNAWRERAESPYADVDRGEAPAMADATFAAGSGPRAPDGRARGDYVDLGRAPRR